MTTPTPLPSPASVDSLPAARGARHSAARPAGIVLAALLVVAGTYAGAWLGRNRTDAPASAAMVARDDSVIATGSLDESAGPADLAAIDVQLAIWGPKAAADPRDDISAGNVAVLELGRGRLTGDAADYDRAAAAADRAVAANPTSTGTRVLKATVLQAIHDFTGALSLADAILREEPGSIDALAVAGDAQLELGRLDAAAASYAKIAATAPGPALDARLARLAWLRGDGPEALRLATSARDEGALSETNDPSFYPAQLGEIARLTGHVDIARDAFAAALDLRPTNQLALLGLARIDAFDGDDAAAIGELRTAAAIAPRPETLALLSDLLDRAGDATGAGRASDTVHVIERLGGSAAALFDRQILGFDLDHGDATRAVLDRATAAARIRPDAAGLDVVAWAAYRLGDLETARSESAKALASGTADARILYHAGAIAIAGGDRVAGLALVRRAIDLGPALDPLDRSAAEALLGSR